MAHDEPTHTRTYRPGPPLSDLIDCFWIARAAEILHSEHALPTGTMEIVINLGDAPLPVADQQVPDRPRQVAHALLYGSYTRPFTLTHLPGQTVIGVHFRAGGCAPFLPVAADGFQNRCVALDQLWGARAIRLRERLLEARTDRARFQILEGHIATCALRGSAHHPAVAYALQALQRPAPPSIAAIAERVNLSHRQLIHVFRAAVGVSPKQFDRLTRFQRGIRRIRRHPQPAWADLALASGYCDQAHFIRDFKAFSGFTPSAYLQRRGRHPLHVPLDD